ncbi:hypothetical protein DIZ76_016872 [Coccidioides immitis]|nr:hypothetical protein DIZ76_016872 [Coccidioides immitis]
MGRRGYLTVLALGRSPYDLPEAPPDGHRSTASPLRSTHPEDYVQRYDSRGHPRNPESKASAKQHRRAKNDILSTMGIVVSGKNKKPATAKERENAALLEKENRYGISIGTLDQIFTFIASWWTSSLSSRIQTFKYYNQATLIQIMSFEQRRGSLVGCYFSGMPAWVCSFALVFCRANYLDSCLEWTHAKVASLVQSKRLRCIIRGCFKAAKFGVSFIILGIVGQTYMFSMLQTLQLIPTFAIPSLRSFLPFGEYSLLQLPPLPRITSVREVGGFLAHLVFSPYILASLLPSIRSVLETRIYYLLRRRLQQTDQPDKLSIHVAAECGLIDWIMPRLGKRSGEEIKRSQLSLTEDIIYEMAIFKKYIMSLFDWRNGSKPDSERRGLGEDRVESLHRRVEQLRRDSSVERAPPSRRRRTPTRGQPQREPEDQARANTDTEEGEPHRILMDEDQRFAQSPLQMREDYFPEIYGTDPAVGTPVIEIATSQDSEPPQTPHSRANTLFSRPPSPDTSPLTSPRVRASLVHQNSEVITMQLELLQGPSNSDPQHQTNLDNGDIDNVSSQNSQDQLQHMPIQDSVADLATDGVSSELVDALWPSDGRNRHPVTTRFHEELDTSMSSEAIPTAGAEIVEPIPAVIAAQSSTLTGPGFEIPGPQLAQDQVQGTGDIQASHSQPLAARPRHVTANSRPVDRRFTVLSEYPADSLSLHLAALLTSILLYPLESIALRGLAFSYLSSRAPLSIISLTSPSSTDTIAGLGLRSGLVMNGIHSLGSWFGGGSSANRISYAGKLALVMGFEAISRATVWGVGTVWAISQGKKRFGWGQL